MKRSKPLPRKRATPRRRAPERVQHVRTKPKAGAPPTAAEKRHIARVRALPCLVPGCGKPSTYHHVRRRPHVKRLHARDHRRGVNLCRAHHLHDEGPDSVERLKEGGFLDKFGIDLWSEAERLWKESEGNGLCDVAVHREAGVRE